MTDAPLTASDATALFAGLEEAGRILIAVSGGPDSLALMALMAEWGRAPLTVATLDHGLREGSADDAAFVLARAGRLGLDAVCETLDIHGTGHAAWREARYAALTRIAQKVGATHIATAHHRDDQAETVLMRLARASGVKGLAGIPARRRLSAGLTLVRPLLSVPKARLIATCEARGFAWRNDPGNDAARYDRARLRHAAPALAQIGLDADAVTATAARMARADAALDAHAGALLARATPTPPGLIALPRTAFIGPAETRARVLALLLCAASGTAEPPRDGPLDEALAWLGDDGPGRRTLHGCTLTRGDTLSVHREPGRAALAPITLAPGEECLFDGRYRLRAKTRLTLSAGLAAADVSCPEGVNRQAWREALAACPVWRVDDEEDARAWWQGGGLTLLENRPHDTLGAAIRRAADAGLG